MASADLTEEEARVASHVLNYLSAHPQSQASIVGITQWWLRQQRIESSLRTVQRVLNHLVSAGLVTEFGRPETGIEYGIDPARRPAVEAYRRTLIQAVAEPEQTRSGNG